MFEWLKNYNEGKFKKPKSEEIESMNGVRNIQERIAGIKLGNAFGLTTREGVMIFKYVELRPHPEKEEQT